MNRQLTGGPPLFLYILIIIILNQFISCRVLLIGEKRERLSFSIEKRHGGRVAIYSAIDPEVENSNNDRALLPYRSKGFIYTGLDLLSLSNFSVIKNRRFALLTNDTGRNRGMVHILSLLIQAGLPPALLLEPEHGLQGYGTTEAEDGIRFDHETNLKILSLYSKKSRYPIARQLRGIELILIDLQNLPVRCYTYITTVTHLLRTAQKHGIEIMILERPNPYGFWRAQGAYLNPKYKTFTSYAPVPFLYSLTLGEYALFMSATHFKKLKLSIIRMDGFRRNNISASLKMAWINPSPNIPSLESALVYAGLVLFEGTNVSLGRGTTRPFVYSGAPWMKPQKVINAFKKKYFAGVQFGTVKFSPTASIYRGKVCHGIQFIPFSDEFNSLKTGYEYMRIVKKLHPSHFRFLKRGNQYLIDSLWGGTEYRKSLEQDLSYEAFRQTWIQDAEDFEKRVKPHRLY